MTFFDKLNLAHCAMRRAQAAIRDTSPTWRTRFNGEFNTVVCWSQHHCYTPGDYHFTTSPMVI